MSKNSYKNMFEMNASFDNAYLLDLFSYTQKLLSAML